MKSIMRYCIALVIFWSLMGCSSIPQSYKVSDTEEYERQHTIWKNQRIRSLTSTEGWLSLEGLFWLKKGKNTFGSREGLDFLFPDFAAPYVGAIFWEADSLRFEAGGESYVTTEEKRIIEGRLHTDEAGKPTQLSHKSLIFYVIKRGDRLGIRLKNTLARKRYRLKKIPSYDINYDAVVRANVKKATGRKKVSVEDITGLVQDYPIQAILSFNYLDKQYELLAFDGGPEHFFIIFNDASNGNGSYGGGRYMYVQRPSPDSDHVILDFNRSINPPCAFTDFATCPIPPDKNVLPILIQAGEKYPLD